MPFLACETACVLSSVQRLKSHPMQPALAAALLGIPSSPSCDEASWTAAEQGSVSSVETHCTVPRASRITPTATSRYEGQDETTLKESSDSEARHPSVSDLYSRSFPSLLFCACSTRTNLRPAPGPLARFARRAPAPALLLAPLQCRLHLMRLLASRNASCHTKSHPPQQTFPCIPPRLCTAVPLIPQT